MECATVGYFPGGRDVKHRFCAASDLPYRRQCAHDNEMIENENTGIVRRWFEEVWNQRQLETIDELLAPDAIAYDLAGPGATIRGRDAFRAAAEAVLKASVNCISRSRISSASKIAWPSA